MFAHDEVLNIYFFRKKFPLRKKAAFTLSIFAPTKGRKTVLLIKTELWYTGCMADV